MCVVSVCCILPLSISDHIILYSKVNVLVKYHHRVCTWKLRRCWHKSHGHVLQRDIPAELDRNFRNYSVQYNSIDCIKAKALLIAEAFMKHLICTGGSNGSLRNPGSRRYFSDSKSLHDSRSTQ